MANTLLLKRSAVQGKTPLLTDLQLGQLAINTYDGRLYTRKDNGTASIIDLGYVSVTGDATGSGSGSISLTLANTGVTAGTYKSVTVDSKGRVTAGTNPTTLSGYGITDAINISSMASANGVATLDSFGKLLTSQIPASLVGAVVYQGVWNASTNSPTLVSGTGTKGNYYMVSVAGSTSIDGISQWNVGDMIIFNGTTWNKIDGVASEVLSVFGRTGAVVMNSTDVSTALGYTPANINSPSFTGSPTSTTPTAGDSSTKIATTAFVSNAISTGSVTSFNTRIGAVTLSSSDITGAGGALLTSLAASGGSSLIGYTIAGSGAVARTVQARLRDRLSVKDYGALGNGGDDTAAINAMLSAIASAATVVDVYFPPGVYGYSGSGFTGNQYIGRIYGAGPSASVIQAVNSSVTGSAFNFNATADGITFQDIAILGPGQSASGGQDGVVIANGGSPVRQPRFVNCEIYNWPGKALNINTPIAGSAHNCRFQNNIHGVYINSGTSFTFYNCYPNGNKKAGYWLNGTTYSSFVSCAADTNGIAYLLSGLTGVTMVGCGNEAGTSNTLTITSSSLTSNIATFTYSGPDQSADFIGNGRTVVIQGSTNIPAANAGASGLGDGRWAITSVGTNTVSISLTSANISSASDSGTVSFWAGDGVVINGSTVVQIQGHRTIAPAQTSSSMLVTEGSASQVTVTGMRSTQGSGQLQIIDMWLGNGTSNIIRTNNAFSGGTYAAANNISTVSNGTWTLPTVTAVNALNTNGNFTATTSSSATSGSNNNSPSINLVGTYWNGSASAQDVGQIQMKPATGANPLVSMNFAHSSGSSGGMQLTVNGTPFLAGNGQFIGTSINTAGNAVIGGTLSVTGVATAPTATAGTNTTQIATTAFVQTATASYLPLAGGTVTGAITLNAAPIVNGTANWTTVNWNKGMRLSATTAIEFAGPSNNHFGIGNSGGILYFFTNTADDNSAAPSYFMQASSAGSVNFSNSITAPNINVSVSGSVAAAGTTQGTGTAITSAINVVTSGTGGVVLPAPTAGMEITVINTLGSALNVYPSSGCQIDALGSNVAFSLGAGAKLCYIATSATQWYSLTAVYA